MRSFNSFLYIIYVRFYEILIIFMKITGYPIWSLLGGCPFVLKLFQEVLFGYRGMESLQEFVRISKTF